MWIMIESLIEDDQFQVLFILVLELISEGKYRLNQLRPLTTPMEKLNACARLSRKLGLSGYTWKP